MDQASLLSPGYSSPNELWRIIPRIIFAGRLDERKRRKEFILERNLLYQSPFEKSLTPEERALCRHYDVFMRFHSKEEHEDLLQTIVAEHRTLKRIKELQVFCGVIHLKMSKFCNRGRHSLFLQH